jgi:hypothetical protein
VAAHAPQLMDLVDDGEAWPGRGRRQYSGCTCVCVCVCACMYVCVCVHACVQVRACLVTLLVWEGMPADTCGQRGLG